MPGPPAGCVQLPQVLHGRVMSPAVPTESDRAGPVLPASHQGVPLHNGTGEQHLSSPNTSSGLTLSSDFPTSRELFT